MTRPNIDTRYDPKIHKRQRGVAVGRMAKAMTILAIVVVIGLLLFCELKSDLPLFTYIRREVKNDKLKPLKQESLLQQQIMKSCLPQVDRKKCNTYIPPEYGSKQRIALIAPAGGIGSTFFRLLNDLTEQSRQEGKLELISTTNMAPYGYGKTHGWTRIIRIVPQPILLGATDTVVHYSTRHRIEDISKEDLKASLRQQIRYHCRLSHITAHTALWTLTTGELLSTPVDALIQQILDFLDMKANGQSQQFIPIIDKRSVELNFEEGFQDMQGRGVELLNRIQKGTQNNLQVELETVLHEELATSKNLTAWPCHSFWTAGEKEDPFRLGIIASNNARAMSPNCSAPFTSCFVPRDKCEGKGGVVGECKSILSRN